MQRVLYVVTFLMFFPVGCSLINDFSADMLERIRRDTVDPKAIPPHFPLIALSPKSINQSNEGALTRSQAQPQPKGLPYTPNLTRYELLASEQQAQYSFNFEKEQLDQIRQVIHKNIRLSHEQMMKAAPIGAEIQEKPPWLLGSLQVLEIFNNGHMKIRVAALDKDSMLHIGWYEATENQWTPTYYLERANTSPKLITLPVSIVLTLTLWLWHRKRRDRMMQWRADYTKQKSMQPTPQVPDTLFEETRPDKSPESRPPSAISAKDTIE